MVVPTRDAEDGPGAQQPWRSTSDGAVAERRGQNNDQIQQDDLVHPPADSVTMNNTENLRPHEMMMRSRTRLKNTRERRPTSSLSEHKWHLCDRW